MRSLPKTHTRAKEFRQTLSPPEMRLWMRLRARHPGEPVFRRQHPVGPYILDFYCAKARLAIEVDGMSHSLGDRPERDARRDLYLNGLGIRVERIAAISVLQEPDEIALGIVALAKEILGET